MFVPRAVRHWKYAFGPLPGETPAAAAGEAAREAPPDEAARLLPRTAEMQRFLLDLPLYHTLTWTGEDFETICAVVRDVVGRTVRDAERGHARLQKGHP